MQIRVYQWFKYQYPEFEYLCNHPPNGGGRDIREAALFKKMGTQAGMPDLMFCIARGGYHGMHVELKLPGEKLNQNQRKVIKALRSQDYYCIVCYSDSDAMDAIKDYLDSKVCLQQKES